MKKTEWFYNHNRKKWWMVSVTTNAENIPTIRLGDNKPTTTTPVHIKGINLHDENKTLTKAILALTGCLGVALAAIVWLMVA